MSIGGIVIMSKKEHARELKAMRGFSYHIGFADGASDEQLKHIVWVEEAIKGNTIYRGQKYKLVPVEEQWVDDDDPTALPPYER